MAKLSTLEQALDYHFSNQSLLLRALTHRSHNARHNERLEFLGDSVLNFVVAALLYQQFDKIDEGDLSRLRASLVKQSSLAEIAQKLQLSNFLKLGEGELKSGGFRRPSILADALEAIFGAVYLDGGYEKAHHVIAHQYATILPEVDPETLGKDPKTRLQEVLQARRLDLPVYTVIATRGAAHSQLFDVECAIADLDIAVQASGSSRRSAEQQAATEALDLLEASSKKSGRQERARSTKQSPASPDASPEQKS